jgi:putative acetyltransferase
MIIRDEGPQDIWVIRELVAAAFKDAPYSSQTEAAIVDGLRDAGALTLSLAAVEGEVVLGHIAFSPVTIDGRERGWFGLGPLAVQPEAQGQGIGQALVRAGLARLRASAAQGCVLLGAPGYYGRFGFAACPQLRLADVPPEYFLALSFAGEPPAGEVRYHPAFLISGT